MASSVAFRMDDLPDAEAFKTRSQEIHDQIKSVDDFASSLGWDVLRDAAFGALRTGLAGQDGITWLAHAWDKAREIEKAAADTLTGEADERVIPLAEHRLKQELFPVVTLSCVGAELPLKFTLVLTAAIECVDLVVQRGWLTAIQAGRLTPSATLSFHGIDLGEKSWEPIDFLQPYQLAKGGIQIIDASEIHSTQ